MCLDDHKHKVVISDLKNNVKVIILGKGMHIFAELLADYSIYVPEMFNALSLLSMMIS